MDSEKINIPKGLCFKSRLDPPCNPDKENCFCCFDDFKCYKTMDDCKSHCAWFHIFLGDRHPQFCPLPLDECNNVNWCAINMQLWIRSDDGCLSFLCFNSLKYHDDIRQASLYFLSAYWSSAFFSKIFDLKFKTPTRIYIEFLLIFCIVNILSDSC